MRTILVIKRNAEAGVWRAITFDMSTEDGIFCVHQVAEDPLLSVAVDYVIRTSSPAPDAILTPEGILDDGGELTLAEAAEALYTPLNPD